MPKETQCVIDWQGVVGKHLKKCNFPSFPKSICFQLFWKVYFQFCPITAVFAMSFPFNPHGSFILKFFIWKMSKGSFQSLKTLLLQKYWKILLRPDTKYSRVCYSAISKHNFWESLNYHYSKLTGKSFSLYTIAQKCPKRKAGTQEAGFDTRHSLFWYLLHLQPYCKS